MRKSNTSQVSDRSSCGECECHFGEERTERKGTFGAETDEELCLRHTAGPAPEAGGTQSLS